MTIQGERPSHEARVGGASPDRISGRCSHSRAPASAPTLAVVAPIAKPSRITHAPTAPSPIRYHVLPEQPPDSTMPTPKTRPPITFASQRKGRTGIWTRPAAMSRCAPTTATSSASTYARMMPASPISATLEIARVKQKPPRWIT
jgi:hypothetical protein